MSSALQPMWAWAPTKSPPLTRPARRPPISMSMSVSAPAPAPPQSPAGRLQDNGSLSFFGHVEPQRPWTPHVAQKTCEMLCYLWFADGIGRSSSHPSPRGRQQQRRHHPANPYPVTNPTTAMLQFNPTVGFVKFVHTILQTTQVSQSVIVLSLHYIYRLKERCAAHPHPGSEFRVVVAGLMMANKFVDDNTYTNKTWAEVSGIPLSEINSMEREFLMGVQYRLYVDKATYESWLNLLKGLVLAMDRESQQWQSRRQSLAGLMRLPLPTHHPPSMQTRPRLYTPASSQQSHRARSSSPRSSTASSWSPYPFTFAPPPVVSHFTNPFEQHRSSASSQPQPMPMTPSPQMRQKRAAMDAFSPDSFAPSQLHPNKRPVSVDVGYDGISRRRSAEQLQSSATLEPLASFAHLSITNKTPPGPGAHQHQTLAAPYHHDVSKPTHAPAELYYYALASSPMDEMLDHVRKARLRSHQPPPSYVPSSYALPPLMVQSANTSPRDISMFVEPQLPSFRPQAPYFSEPVSQSAAPHQLGSLRVPSAPFANAGPPGVEWATPRHPIETHYLNQQRQFGRYSPAWSTQPSR